MFVVDSKKWRSDLASGQERLFVEMWMECAGTDTTCLYWSPLCSTLQTVRNVLTALNDVERKILKEYHIPHLAEEALARTEDCGWLDAAYKADLMVLRELLQKLRGQNSDPNEPAATDKSAQAAVRTTTASFLKAFIAKVERDNPVTQQVELIRKLVVAEPKTRFEVLERAVAELVNDLVHAGHSRDHLNAWMRGTVLEKKDDIPYLTRFQSAQALGVELAGGCDVLFLALLPPEVTEVEGIAIQDALPDGFLLAEKSTFRSPTKKRYVVVRVERAVDRQAARDVAHNQLVRYLHSTRLAAISFSREVASKAAVRVVGSNETYELQGFTPTEPHKLHNDAAFYQMPRDSRDEGTFAELDRVLYWLEQSRKWDDVGRLIALWTALEFLFSKTEESALKAVQDALPAYLVPKYARELLLDLWVALESADEVTLPDVLETQLDVETTKDEKGRKRRKASLVKLLDLCLQDDKTNPLKAVIKDYPILLRKYYRVRRLNPSLKLVTSSDPEIWRDLDRFEREQIFDLRYAYRARNTVVHDAAIQIVQIEPLIQRVNWMLCTALDSLLFQFVQNPTLSLAELHAVNALNFGNWKKRLRDEKVPVPLAEIVDMPQTGLATK